jgi:hypothetical protein
LGTRLLKDDIIIRLGCDKDLSFIYHSWLNSFYKSFFIQNYKHHTFNDKVEMLALKNAFMASHRKKISGLLQRSNIHMLHPLGQPDDLIGYAVFEAAKDGLLLHYIYLKNIFRQMGIGSAFFSSIVQNFANGKNLVATHDTRYLPMISKKWNLIFNPYLLGDMDVQSN